MMMTRQAAPSGPLPLLCWEELAVIDRLRAERDELSALILTLPPRSYRRIVLEARLAELTARQLALETDLRGRP